MANKFQASRRRIVTLVLVMFAGGALAITAVLRTLRASRRVEAVRSNLLATKSQLVGLEGSSDEELHRLSAMRKVADLKKVASVLEVMGAAWQVSESPEGKGQRAWLLRASGVRTQRWPDILRQLAAIDGMDGVRIEVLNAALSDGSDDLGTLTVEARVLATLSLSKEGRQ